MVRIRLQHLENRVLVSENTNRKVIEIIHENGIDWMHACGKKGRCTTCKIRILEGQENLSPETAQELLFRSQHRLLDQERLGCQASLLEGSLTIQ
jgi:ferredoxin, 2Fe-2S